MKAVQFWSYGGPEVLQVADVDEPHAGAGQVRVAVRSAGINPSDLMKVRAGEWKGKAIPLPSGIGVEAAGVVDEVGAGTVARRHRGESWRREERMAKRARFRSTATSKKAPASPAKSPPDTPINS